MNRQLIGRPRVIVALVAVVAWLGWAVLAGEQPAPPGSIVRLVVDYGEGVEKHYTALPFAAGMTVEGALKAASGLAAPRGLSFEAKGEGERCLLLSIDGLKNEGGGKGARNWLYWINGTPGDRSFAVATMAAGDTATWRFAPYDALKAGE
jgi:hypothetical protein